MRLTLEVCRKEGRAGYSSDGCMCRVEVELSEATVSENPLSLHDEARRILAYCDAVVTEQLAKTAGQAEPPARDRLPSQARPPSTPEPTRQPPNGQQPRSLPNDPGSKPHNGFPRSGRELVPWAKKREESGEFPNLWKRLIGYGVSRDFPGRVVEWSREEVIDAVHSVLGEGYDDPEPAPAGRNGYSRNGYSH